MISSSTFQHDSTSECAPGGSAGNFIMFARATSGDQKNNRLFSPCSKQKMNAVMNVKGRCAAESCCFKGTVKFPLSQGWITSAHVRDVMKTSKSPRYPYPAAGTDNKDLWDKAFCLHMCSTPCFKGMQQESWTSGFTAHVRQNALSQSSCRWIRVTRTLGTRLDNKSKCQRERDDVLIFRHFETQSSFAKKCQGIWENLSITLLLRFCIFADSGFVAIFAGVTHSSSPGVQEWEQATFGLH